MSLTGGTDGTDSGTSKAGRGWAVPGAPPTRLLLVRHGETDHTTERRFSGGLAGANPGLNDIGRAQVQATAAWMASAAEQIDVVLASPVRRTRESAEILAEALGQHEVLLDDGFAEMEFGTWDGMTFAEVWENHQPDMEAWFGSLEVAAGGGESFLTVQERVLAGLDRVLTQYAGKTIAVVSHVTPIKTLVAHALAAPLTSLYRLELSPASLTAVNWYLGGPDGDEPMGSLRAFNTRPGADGLPI